MHVTGGQLQEHVLTVQTLGATHDAGTVEQGIHAAHAVPGAKYWPAGHAGHLRK